METILIDMDDVITTDNFKRLIENYLGKQFDYSDVNGYYIQDILPDKDDFFDNYFFEHDLYAEAKLIEDAYEVIKKLNKIYNVYICSDFIIRDRPNKSGIHLNNKFNFLIKVFDFLKPNQFIFSANKNIINVDIRIDDKVNHLENGKLKLLFSTYHNLQIPLEDLKRNDIVRVNSWKEIENILINN